MDILHPLAPIFMLICGLIGTTNALIFISIVIFSRRCRSINILLVFNSTIAGLIINVTCISQAIYQLTSDGNDRLCSFRGFILMAGTGLLYHTLCVQALYRLFVTVFSTQRSLISKHTIICIVIIQWIFTIIFGIPILVTGRIIYRAASRICLVPMSDIFSFIYFGLFNYAIPLTLINGIYMRIIKYMKQTSLSIAVRHSIAERQRQRREIRLIRRILMIVIILFMMGFPYLIFFILYQFKSSLVPNSIDTICSLFIGFGLAISMLINIMNTDDVRNILLNTIGIKKSINKENTIQNIHTLSISMRKIVPIPINR